MSIATSRMMALCLLLLCHGAVAADWDLAELMRELSARSGGHARFVEKKYLAVLDQPLEQSGELSFAPGRLEKLTLLPRRERVIIDGDALTIETEGRNKPRRLRLRNYPALWGLVEGLRATLSGDLETLQRFYTIKLTGPRVDWELALAPRVDEMRAVVEQIRIRGIDANIRQIELTEAKGDRALMQIIEDGS